jgi:protein-L-isoaspartate(D-aspartate) O-methyltransferase
MTDMPDFAQAKFNMIEQQIRPWEVLDPQVLAVFHELQRDQFVPEQYKGLAYADCRLPVFEDESMLPPTLEGRMLQALNLKSTDSVLEVGTCSGYITACLARLAAHVSSVDRNVKAVELAGQNLQAAGIDNVELNSIDSLTDIQHAKRFDAIAVTAGSLPVVPENLKNALTIGGRLFAVTGQSPVKHATVITRTADNEWDTRDLFETDIPEIKA